MNPKPKLSFLVVRVTSEMHSKFHAKSRKYAKPSEVMRELVEAFLEDRLTITPPVKRKESLYVTRTQD